MNIIKRLSNVLQFLDTEGSNLASEAWIDLDYVIEKITSRYAKGDIVRSRLLPETTYEIDKVMFNFVDDEEYCHIKNEYQHFVVKSKDLERIE